MPQFRIAAHTESEALRHYLHQVAEKVDDHCEQRPAVKRDIEGEALILPTQQPWRQREVRAAGDGQKFGQPLQQSKDDHLKQGHNG